MAAVERTKVTTTRTSFLPHASTWRIRPWLALLLLAGMTGCSQPSATFRGIDLTGADWGRELRLQDPQGRIRNLQEFQGKVVLLFFGFTQCPDVCPTALARAAQMRKQLGADGEKLQVIFVTVDPDRDTPALLREYTAAFDPSFLALRGSDEETRRAAAQFKVSYDKVPSGASYTVNHTSLTYLLDLQGRLRVALQHTQSVDDYISDVRTLLNQTS